MEGKTTKAVLVLILLFVSVQVLANGVVVIDAGKGVYMKMKSSNVSVSVENQVAVVTATQEFLNIDSQVYPVYAFPMPAGASATKLRWFVGGIWHEATISAKPQDTTLPSSGGGKGVPSDLGTYLGATPLFMNLGMPVAAKSTMIVELTYVQLLVYDLGTVSFSYPNDYRLIQKGGLIGQKFHMEQHSAREIVSMSLINPLSTNSVNDGHFATIDFQSSDSTASTNYDAQYLLSSTDLGLFGFSTRLETVCDAFGKGFFLFVAEPNSGDQVDAIDKVFTLIIDCSGSMNGTKIDQARNAATFIVQNLNVGDRFNIVQFSDNASSFRSSHVAFDASTKTDALSYINGLKATNSTNISGAFETALRQFPDADSSVASIIIFLTDGVPTAGITARDPLVKHIDDRNMSKKAAVFCFGIGGDVDKVLLTRIAADNNGLADFLDNSQLQTKISNFYLKIRNPVLLDSKVTFSPPTVEEVYPTKLPNLYKGQQMLVTGRYEQAAHPLAITLGGLAFGKHVEYQYYLDLSDTAIPDYQWLPKIWAKMKIEDLLVRYNSVVSTSALADSIRKEVVSVSLCFGVITPFTSFSIGTSGNDRTDTTTKNGGGTASSVSESIAPDEHETITAFPNPFNTSTLLNFGINSNEIGGAEIHIYSIDGRLIRTLHCAMAGSGQYKVIWDGKDESGSLVSNGEYLCILSFKNTLLVGHVIKQ